MNKKVMAVAVAGVFATPALALAQASTVQIYGNINVQYNWVDLGNARYNIDMLNSYDSNIGFRGEEKLAGGISAWFQCESTLNVTGSDSDGVWCARNSAVGLKGAWGNVFVGNWDTPAKISAGPARPFSTSGAYGMAELLWNGSASNVGNGAGSAGVIGTGSTGNAAAGFSRRQANTINYHSPSWSGFNFMAGFSTVNETTAMVNPSTFAKPRLWSLGAAYSQGPIYVGVGYEQHHNYNPASQAAYTGGNDTMWSIGAAYTFAGVFKLSAIYTDIKYETNTAAASTSSKRQGYGIYGDWTIQGPHQLTLGYSRADDTKGNFGAAVAAGANCPAANAINTGWCANAGTGGTAASLYAIRYTYNMSKRTNLNFGYAQLSNDTNARYALQTLARPASAGQNASAWVFGINHKF